MDMIGQTILNTTLGAQNGYNVLADCMLNQIRWHQTNANTNPFEYLNFVRRSIHWHNGRQMDDYIGKELDKRYHENRTNQANVQTKAVIDLVLQAANSQDSKPLPEKIDPAFRQFAIRQIRLFMFAGHDSTSSTICYIIHLMSSDPDSLARLRAEHDTILGRDPSEAERLLNSKPQLISSLVYTNAVIKESLRLFTPAGCSRGGKSGVSLINEEGQKCPTDDAIVWLIHVETHRSPEYWPRPDEFLPERWLVDPSHELYPMKGAWRPFEHGPRNCPAQGLVMTELAVVLAMIAREFNFQPSYDEWDRLHPRKGLRTYRGERAYQIEEGAAHPVDKTPLVIIHGGPGACHDYLLPLADLASSHSIPVVFYDQIGNGRSTHIPDKNGDEDFWTEDLFRAELDNLLVKLGPSNRPIDVLGHSWGGMLAVGWAAKQPPNLRRLIISNSLASMDAWRIGIRQLRSELPQDIQRVLDRCDESKDFESPEYEAAIEAFYKRHLSLARPWPCKEVQAALDWFAKDATTYGTMYGPSELYISGSLRGWTSIPMLSEIKAPTLLINGSQDEAQDVAMKPFFEHVPKVKWVTLDDAAHFAHVDQTDRYLTYLADFIKDSTAAEQGRRGLDCETLRALRACA
ncbi:MAG: hypothetical protein Q9160_001909 [Pyrenula sp. 1 TL-2023]